MYQSTKRIEFQFLFNIRNNNHEYAFIYILIDGGIKVDFISIFNKSQDSRVVK